jgi:xylulokinase
MSLLGIDIGTAGCKAVAFSETGVALAARYEEYPLIVPYDGFCEIDPKKVWNALCRVVRGAAEEVRRSNTVRAAGISTLGDSVTPTDQDGNPLYNTVVGAADGRASAQAERIEKLMPKRKIFDLTGMPLHAYCTIPKVLWFKENLPELFGRTARFAGWQEIVHKKLGIDPRMDFSLASHTMLMDISEKRYAGKLFDLCGLEESLFYPLSASHAVVGETDSCAAGLLGLDRGVKVVAGGFDQACCALGAGVFQKDTAALGLGTLGAVTAVYEAQNTCDALLEGNYGCSFHVLDGLYMTFGYLTTAGAVLRWYRDVLGNAEVEEANKKGLDPFEVMIGSTPDRPAAVYVLPYFTGTGTPWLDLTQRGSIFGLSLDTDRAEIVKGVLDGICYEIRLNIDMMRGAGIPIETLRATGGGSKSTRWMQLVADITGLPVETTAVTEAGCLGAALLAGIGTGVYNGAEDLKDIARTDRVFGPNTKKQAEYEDKYNTYLGLRERVRGLVLNS